MQSLQPSLSYLGSLLQFGSSVLLIALFLLLRPYALLHIVEMLRPKLRVADKLYRWGGDEFLLVFPGADAPHVGRRIKAILHESKPLHLADGAQLPVRVSVGAAAYPSGEKIDDAIAAADQAMYSDKVSRKNAFDAGMAQIV